MGLKNWLEMKRLPDNRIAFLWDFQVFVFLGQCRCKVLYERFEVSLFCNFLVGNCIVQYACHKLVVCPIVEAFRTDSSYFFHSRIVFDVKQSWERVPLPYLDGGYSKISLFSFIFGVFCSRKQRFLSLFVCCGVRNGVFHFFAVVFKVEMTFLVTLGLWGKKKTSFLVLLICRKKKPCFWYFLSKYNRIIAFVNQQLTR